MGRAAGARSGGSRSEIGRPSAEELPLLNADLADLERKARGRRFGAWLATAINALFLGIPISAGGGPFYVWIFPLIWIVITVLAWRRARAAEDDVVCVKLAIEELEPPPPTDISGLV